MAIQTTRDRADFLAGILVIAAVASLLFLALQAANLNDAKYAEVYTINISLANTGDIKKKSPVKSSGIIIGRVSNLELDIDKYEAVVQIAISSNYRFPKDSIFSVVSTNLLGGQYINIEAGGDEEFLADNDTVVGNSAIILEELISKFLFNEAGNEESTL